MAILNNLKHEEYNKIQDIIEDVFNSRKLRFNIDTILEIIKERVLANKISKDFVDCSYFYILVLNTLDKLIEEGRIYQIGNTYIPADFIVFVNYSPVPSNLLYYNEKKQFINIDNFEEVSYDKINNLDVVLCGGYSDLLDNKYQVLTKSDVSIEEISNLYHDLIKEGASREYAMILILNHYKVQVMPHNLNFINDFFPNKPQIKKLSRKKIIHKISE